MEEPLDQDRTMWCETLGMPAPPTPHQWTRYLRLPPGAKWLGPWKMQRVSDGFIGFEWTRRASRRDDGFVIRRTMRVGHEVRHAALAFG